MIIGTAGHIDHGKTALVKALTGVDTARLPEEKRRGITIDLGFAPLVLPGVGTVGVVDVPGHDAFVKTMVAGATGIDLALLVIAADEGVMPQTREHIAILDLLGVTHGVVALTKVDLVDRDLLELVDTEVEEALRDTALAGVLRIPVSATTGAGLTALTDALAAAARSVARRDTDDIVRMPVDRVFSKPGSGTVVTGTLWSGRLQTGDAVTLLPADHTTRVRGLQSHGVAVEVAEPGTRVAVALTGVKREDAGRGATLVRESGWHATSMIRADVTLLPSATVALGPRTRVRFHLGTTDVGARVVVAGGPLQAGETRPARIVFDKPIVVARGGDRFVLRRPSPPSTIGGGIVTDPFPGPRRRRAFPAAAISARDRVVLIAIEAGTEGISVESLPVRLGLTPTAVDVLVNSTGEIERIADDVVARKSLVEAGVRVAQFVAAYHKDHPRESGAPLDTARDASRGPPHITAYVLAQLVKQGTVTIEGALIRAENFRPQANTAQDAQRDALLARLIAVGAEVPSVSELTRDFGNGVMGLLRQLERAGSVVALNSDRFASAEVASDLWTRVSSVLSPGTAYRVSDLRPVFSLTRQYLIAWLEYFDRTGRSRRDGDLRWFNTRT